MIINGIDFGPIVPVRLTVRPSQAIERGACHEGFNEVIDKCCPEIKGNGLDERRRYILTSDPEISLADMIKAGVSWGSIGWSFQLLEGPEAERTLRLFAAACAAEVLPVFEAERPGDDRPRAATEAVVGYAHGTVTREQLVAADAAAWAAAWDAANVAAWDAAARAADAAARASARASARAAADAAAWAAADAAARASACAAARSAAGDAACAADAAALAAAWDAANVAAWDAAARAAAWAALLDAAIMRQREILLTFVEVTP